MDERLEGIVRGALGKLGGAALVPSAPVAGPAGMTIEQPTLGELSRLAYLQAGDPLVDRVLEALRSGASVTLDRACVEEALKFAEYPAAVREQFGRWFERIARLGVILAPENAPPPPASPAEAPAADRSAPAPGPLRVGMTPTADREVLFEILGDTFSGPRPCYREPGRTCSGCNSCRTLGY